MAIKTGLPVMCFWTIPATAEAESATRPFGRELPSLSR
jgi:hypothetical protein